MIQPGDSRSCCFTKSYGRYAEGTGSVLIGPEQAPMLDGVYDQVRSLPKEDAEAKLQLLRSLRIRFFTPREVARLMGFPEAEDGFSFPAESTKIQCYRVLGNSLNVTLVAFLLQLLFEEK